MRLLITRPEPEASRLADELRRRDHEPLLQPLLIFQALPFNNTALNDADALIISSGSALRALSESGQLNALSYLPLYCVGAETAQKAKAAGFTLIRAAAGTGEALAAEIIKTADRHKRLVHLSGQHQAFDFTAFFAKQELSFCTFNVYAMKARLSFDGWMLDVFQKRFVEGVILLSPRTAEVFVDLCEKHCLTEIAKDIRYYCLSHAIASKLDRFQAGAVFVAGKPLLNDLLTLLEAKSNVRSPRQTA